MAAPRLVTIRDFNTSIYSQLADTTTANLSDVLASAEQSIERKLKRPIAPTEIVERFYPKSNKLYLKQRPIITIDSVTRAIQQGYAASAVTSYDFDADAGTLWTSTPLQGYYVTVTYHAGFTILPDDLKQAILMQAALFAFQDLEFYGSGDAKEPGILYVKKDIQELIEPYKQLHMAYTEEYQW